MIVKVENLSKTYGTAEVLKDVHLELGENGAIVGILGPNGAGKTTLVEIIEGLRVPDHGSVRVLGIDPLRDAPKLRERLGVQLQSTVLPPELTPLETLRLFAAFYARSRPARELLDLLGLAPVAGVLNGRLSIGQQRLLAIALALVNDPELIILDEPTSGLDPVARREVHTHLAALKTAGRTILLTSHDLDEVERLCSRAILIRDGEILADGSPSALAARSGGAPTLWVAVNGVFDDGPLRRAGAASQGTHGGFRRYATPDPTAAILALARILERDHLTLTGLELRFPSLEEFYLDLMGRSEAPQKPGPS